MKMSSYYDTTGKGRQLEVDIVKGMAVLFMFAVHCYEQFYYYDIMDSNHIVHIIRFFGGPLAAPVFMICMGISMNYTKKNTPKDFIWRGIKLFFAGYLLQIGRDMIPFILKALIHSDNTYLLDGVYYTFGNDIMVFAGLSYIFMGLFKKSKLSDKWLYVIWAVCAIANVILLPIQFPNQELYAAFSGLLWGSWENSWFPFFTWIFFPLAGYCFGKSLKQTDDKDAFYKKRFLLSGTLFVPLTIIAFLCKFDFGELNGLFHGEYYHHNWYGNIYIFNLFLIWISAFHFIFTKWNVPHLILDTLKRWSGHLNTMYCVQWIFLGFLSVVVPYYVQPLWVVIIIFLTAITISDFVSYKIKGR